MEIMEATFLVRKVLETQVALIDLLARVKRSEYLSFLALCLSLVSIPVAFMALAFALSH